MWPSCPSPNAVADAVNILLVHEQMGHKGRGIYQAFGFAEAAYLRP